MPNYDKYQELWDTMIIEKKDAVIEAAKLIISNKETYKEVVEGTSIRWEFVGAIHYRESTCDFKTHLHNGDSLKKRTVNVPIGRPLGIPPFTWQESAKDALITLKHLDTITNWALPNILWHFELYNGLGYQKYHTTVNSPYLWSGTNHYQCGKYASDGKFDADLIDKQMGAAPIFRYITDHTLELV